MIPAPRKSFRLRFALTVLLCLLPAVVLGAAPDSPAASNNELPSSLGTIVYQQHPDNPCQLYIVANSHRSCATGANGTETVRAQIETFRIGEWLLKRQHLDLLLPEGFFGRGSDGKLPLQNAKPLDGRTLEERLADTSTFVNAELLLHRHYRIGLYQVEDRALYNRTSALLRSGLNGSAGLSTDFGNDLAYLQERRLAAILQNVPAALASVDRQGRIAAPKVMLTIGLAHLADIVRYLETGEIFIPSPPDSGGHFPSFQAQLALDRQDVGVTIIVPRSLLSNPTLAQLTPIAPDAAPKR